MTMRRIETAIDIAADSGTVWNVLMDFSSYPDWNPFIRRIEGRTARGERLAARIEPPGQRGMQFRPTVQVVQERHAFSWLGHLLIPGLFDGLHEFRLQPNGSSTRLSHCESFSGVLVPFVWSKLETPTRAGFEAMNHALKARAETLAAGKS